MECNQEFASDALFQQHKQSGHQTKGSSLEPLPTTAMPTPEFMEAVQRIEAEVLAPSPKLNNPAVALDGTKLEVPEPKPIKLKYVFEGDCPTCRKPVSTLELQVKDSHFVIAYCETCKQQLQEREEKNLDGNNGTQKAQQSPSKM